MRGLVILALFISTSAQAVPLEFSHQGRIMDPLGAALTGPHDIAVGVYSSGTGGTAVWSDSVTTPFDNGYFSVQLTGLNESDYDVDDLWVGIAVDGGAELPTRVKLSSVPFAIRAGNADTAMNIDSGANIDVTSVSVNGSTIINTAGSINYSSIIGAPTDSDVVAGLGCGTDFDIARLESGVWVCAADNDHPHDASQLTSGTLDIARIPVGDTSGTVSAGDHVHATGGTVGNLLLAFEFDEPSGTTFVDASGRSNTGVATGAIAAGSGGHTGNSIAFVGGGVTVGGGNSVPDSPQIGVEAWINPNLPLTGKHQIAMQEGVWSLYQQDDGVVFDVETAGGACSVNTGRNTLSAGAWHAVTANYSGWNVTVTLDGAASTVTCNTGALIVGGGAPLHIGADASGGSPADSFQGNIDEVRLWALTGVAQTTLPCRPGFWAINGGRLCMSDTEQTAAGMYGGAMQGCEAQGAHVCEFLEMRTACGAGFDPYTTAPGWYGDHGTAAGGNWDDEFGSWNGTTCSVNNDGPAMQSGTVMPYRCCY